MTLFSLHQSPASRTPVWIRWMPLWHCLFYLSLALATGIALFDDLHTWQYTLLLLGLSLLLGFVVRGLCHNIPTILARTFTYHDGLPCCWMGNLV